VQARGKKAAHYHFAVVSVSKSGDSLSPRGEGFRRDLPPDEEQKERGKGIRWPAHRGRGKKNKRRFLSSTKKRRRRKAGQYLLRWPGHRIIAQRK